MFIPKSTQKRVTGKNFKKAFFPIFASFIGHIFVENNFLNSDSVIWDGM